MTLKDEFQELGYELARIIKNEIDLLRQRANSSIEFIEKETDKKIIRDLSGLERELILNAEFQLNKLESDKINEINKKILHKKTEYVEKFIQKMKIEVLNKISNDYDSYTKYLATSIENYSSLITSRVEIFFNSEDLPKLKAHPLIFPKLNDNIKISSIPIDIICGFKIKSLDKTFVIDHSFNAILEKNKNDISMEFMEIFPIFQVNVENAMQIYEKMHNGVQKNGNSR
jgi:vacuolar-type H+-ATPase subunit E/Vma4